MDGGLDLFSEVEEDSSDRAWSVSAVTKQARRLIESGFTQVWVRGEVTGFKAYRSGHWYFTLRDADAQVRCVMWRNANRSLPVPPEEGSQVFVEAKPTVWEERGEFRLTVKRLVPTDEGGVWKLQLENRGKSVNHFIDHRPALLEIIQLPVSMYREISIFRVFKPVQIRLDFVGRHGVHDAVHVFTDS